jgi:hypothetical protein
MLLGLSAMLMLALPAAAGAAAWGPEFSVSGPPPEGAGGYEPAVAIDGNGNATYVWQEYQPVSNRSVLRSRVVSANGVAGPVEEITTTADPGESAEPRIGIDGSGSVHVAWKQQQWSCSPYCSSAYQLETVVLDQQGSPIGAPVEVVGYPLAESSLSNLSFAVNSGGTEALAFTHSTSSPATNSVVAYVVSAAGVATEVSPTGTAPPIGPTAIAINDSGQMFAAWAADDESPPFPYAEDVEGALLGGATATARILNPAEQYGGFQELGAMIDAAGNGTVVYGAQPPGSSGRVYAVRLNADESVAGPGLISDESSTDWAEVRPDGAAVRSDGSILVAWSQGEDSWVTPLSPSGTPGAPVELTPGAATGWSPHLGLGPAGDGVVLLESSTEVEPGVFTPRLDQVPIAADGQPSGPSSTIAHLLKQESWFESTYSAVAVSASGNAAAAWIEYDSSVNSSEVRGAFRDGIPPAVSLWVPAKALAGEPTVMAASGEDANPISYSWSFGDGSTGTGSVASHAYAAPGTYAVNVTATDSAGNSSSRQGSIQVVAAGTGVASVRPETKVLKAPPKKTRKRTVDVRFVASEAGSKFECALDAAGWKPCRSPLKLKDLKPGSHELKLRATSPSGVVEAGGPVLRFRVLKPKNHG